MAAGTVEPVSANYLVPSDSTINVLLVARGAIGGLIECALGGDKLPAFGVERVEQFRAALQRMRDTRIDIVLLDLDLCMPGDLEQVLSADPSALVLVLTAADAEAAGQQAVSDGAHDYFVKGNIDGYWLPRALRYLLERKIVEDALRSSAARFQAMSDASPLGIFVSDAQGECVYTNVAYQRISGLDLQQTLGTKWSTAVHPEDRQRVLQEWREAALGRAPFKSEMRFLRADGSIVWARLNSAAMRDAGLARGQVQTVEDISERKNMEFVLRAAEEALFAEKERAQVTLNSIGDGVLTTDLLGNLTYLNLVAETLTGWSQADALNRPLTDVFKVIDGKSRAAADNPAQRAIDEDRTVPLAADRVLIRRDGSESAIEDSSAPIHNRDGKVSGAVIVFHDVSESRAMVSKMAHLAQHDFLTGLPNRALLSEHLSQAIGLAQRNRKQVALLFLDLDYFKHVNDSLGHLIGDQLLQSAADRLIDCVRVTDTVCRQGGDEFVILLTEISQPQDAMQVAEKVLAAFTAPHLVDSHELHLALSIGISIYPDDGNNADVLMQNADTAMYYAKANGRNNFQFFRGEMNTHAVQRLFIESSFRRALKHGEFLLHYQPQIDLASGAIIGAEALVRWCDPDSGLVGPEQFVPIAEQSGLIIPIGCWVLREACQQVRTWLDAGLPAVPVAINISALEFRHANFVEGVALTLQEIGLAPQYLEFELTESVLMEDVESSAKILEALQSMGVQLAIDDFGTGYSSLSYLSRFPISTLKIDQSFVHDIAVAGDSAAIVSAVIGMGKSLNQRVIAEGVETVEQLDFLRSQQCGEAQGFLFSHPLPAADFAQLLISGVDLFLPG